MLRFVPRREHAHFGLGSNGCKTTPFGLGGAGPQCVHEARTHRLGQRRRCDTGMTYPISGSAGIRTCQHGQGFWGMVGAKYFPEPIALRTCRKLGEVCTLLWFSLMRAPFHHHYFYHSYLLQTRPLTSSAFGTSSTQQIHSKTIPQ